MRCNAHDADHDVTTSWLLTCRRHYLKQRLLTMLNAMVPLLAVTLSFCDSCRQLPFNSPRAPTHCAQVINLQTQQRVAHYEYSTSLPDPTICVGTHSIVYSTINKQCETRDFFQGHEPDLIVAPSSGQHYAQRPQSSTL